MAEKQIRKAITFFPSSIDKTCIKRGARFVSGLLFLASPKLFFFLALSRAVATQSSATVLA
jgi:hypothetical protein